MASVGTPPSAYSISPDTAEREDLMWPQVATSIMATVEAEELRTSSSKLNPIVDDGEISPASLCSLNHLFCPSSNFPILIRQHSPFYFVFSLSSSFPWRKLRTFGLSLTHRVAMTANISPFPGFSIVSLYYHVHVSRLTNCFDQTVTCTHVHPSIFNTSVSFYT